MHKTKRFNDNELVAAIKHTSALAEQELYLRYFNTIKNYAFHKLKSYHDAEDIAQTVFRIVLGENKIQSFRGDCKLSYWLLRITRNQCITLQRKRNPELLLDFNELQHFINSAKVSNKASIETEYTFQRVRKILAELPSKYQSVLYLFYFKNLTCESIATMLKLPVNSVCVYLQRGRDKMKKRLTTNKNVAKFI